MKVIKLKYDEIDFIDNICAATGYFDGIHQGHKSVIDNCKRIAKENNLKTALITFNRSPKSILRSSEQSEDIMSNAGKAIKLESMGVDYLILLDFDKDDLSRISPKDFVQNVLVKIGVKDVTCGDDWKFGSMGAGNPLNLEGFAEGKINAHPINIINYFGNKIGTTSIKDLLLNNNLVTVTEMLGHDYWVCGTVIKGNQIGRTIGFPTANIKIKKQVNLLLRGAFAINIEIDGVDHNGIANVGFNPTINDEEVKSMEVYVFDFNKDIYGAKVKVTFKSFLRPEQRFETLEELKAQITKDTAKAKELLT